MRLHSFRALLLLLNATLAACSAIGRDTTAPNEPAPRLLQTTTPATSDPAVPSGASLWVAPDAAHLDGAEAAQVAETRYRLGSLRELAVRFVVPPASGRDLEWVTVRVYTPRGALFRTLRAPFSNVLPAGTQVVSPGAPHLVSVQAGHAVAKGMAYDLSILVAGTGMQRQPIAGTWTISAELDGFHSMRVSRSVVLTL